MINLETRNQPALAIAAGRPGKPETRKGFTLIELVMAIVIGAIILIPTSFIVVQSLHKTFLPEYFTIASSLLEDRIEWVTNLRFSDNNLAIGEGGPINFGGNFSDYAYKLRVNYVNPGDLDTPVEPTVTDYKRVKIEILRSGFPDVGATTLRTNN